MESRPHTAVYKMHKYFARRPWNIFSSLINQYSSPGEIILDPFCGGGVTVIESLKLRRKAVGIDSNPVAVYVTTMESNLANLSEYATAFDLIRKRIALELSSLYRTTCRECGSDAVADWLEWDEKSTRILRVKLDCGECGSVEKTADRSDQRLVRSIERAFQAEVKDRGLWFPLTKIPPGDKTDSLLKRNTTAFHELFTRRNLLALALLRKEILKLRNKATRDLLLFTLSSSLKWASRQSHLRGSIVEGWALHAYWIYPRSLEMNVWGVFKRRYQAITRGKEYSNQHIGSYCRVTDNFSELSNGEATCSLLNRDATELPLPDNSIDAVITDPPYGGNVNYAELSDFWYIWLSKGATVDKRSEAVVNRTQKKSITEYGRTLERVFRECYRVLKQGRFFVSTFNSKDFRIVTQFILAASNAGFTLSPDGAKYQAPIRPYATTFHAMQIGAFVGDFIFTFKKEPREPAAELNQMDSTRARLAEVVTDNVNQGRPEPNLRQQAYELLIPFLVKHAISDPGGCRAMADFFEGKINENDRYFRKNRRRIVAERRRTFGARDSPVG